MDLNLSPEFDLPEQGKQWNAGFALHQLIINEVNELLCKAPNNIPQIEELLLSILDLIQETNYGRDEFFIMIEHLKTLDKKLTGYYMKEYQRIYSSKISV